MGETGQPDEPTLARLVQDALERRRWTLRKAAKESQVGQTTIDNMRRGQRVGPEHIARFARAIAHPGREAETIRYFLSRDGWDSVFYADAGPAKKPIPPRPLGVGSDLILATKEGTKTFVLTRHDIRLIVAILDVERSRETE